MHHPYVKQRYVYRIISLVLSWVRKELLEVGEMEKDQDDRTGMIMQMIPDCLTSTENVTHL
jgi:hypothetical protein